MSMELSRNEVTRALEIARPAILIVDDIEANLEALAAVLRVLDCDIVKARSGKEAVRLLFEREFAAALLDVQMPGMDGYEVARLARVGLKSRDVPIIFVTAMLESQENMFRGYESGAVDVLFKPLNPYVVVSKVKVFLELHRSRCQLQREIEAHEHTLAELDAFNYSVSHDLRAPLRPISGFAAALLEDYGDRLDDVGRGLLLRIEGAAVQMGRLIDELLRLSQISRATPNKQPVDLTKTVEAIVAELRNGDASRRVDVFVRPDMNVRGDPQLLRIALENLLRNAWKFTGKTAAPLVEVGVRMHGAEPAYFVADNGVGFDPAYANKLFRAFQRLHSDTEFEGNGIGLAIVERVIRHHGGRVWAEGSPSGGATFYFTLP
jgi:signal transduction histidine kinase